MSELKTDAPVAQVPVENPLESESRPDGAEPGPAGWRWNYWMLVFEGAFFGGAMSLISTTTLLPKMVQTLQGPGWLISAVPVLGPMGSLLPPILIAHHVERLHHFKPWVLTCCLAQRLPFGLAAVLLLCIPDTRWLALSAVVLAPLLSGILGGLGVTAWQQLFSRCIPRHRRPSTFAVRSIISGLLNVAAGFSVVAVLRHWPLVTGLGVLHLLAFGVLLISFAIMAQVREPVQDERPSAPPPDLLDHLSSVPREIFANRQFLLLLVAKCFRNGLFILTPTLALHAQQSTARPDSFLGQLVVAQMIGSLVGFVLSGVVGDRFGSKIAMQCGLVLQIAQTLWTLGAHSAAAWLGIFVTFGIASSMGDVANMVIGLEMGRAERRATFLAVASLINLPGMLVASSLSWLLQTHYTLQSAATSIALAIALIALVPLKDRSSGAATAAA